MKKFLIVLFLAVATFMQACGPDTQQVGWPYKRVEKRLNVNNYPELTKHNGFMYLNDVGIKGILLVNNNDGSYRAFDRLCSYFTEHDCKALVMDEDTGYSQIIDPSEGCRSHFSRQGRYLSGPALNDLLPYQVADEGNGNLLIYRY
ncbi:hypothetical protein [Persicobacter psychrovividus]|uniref:Rieske domain-containing protein n=1 Tax=Persicobacter psychrovividus TaxID=387638 RepID=A0ABN6LE96_9BACT|nr:hypothetical protein PEPS_22780 [Persicobacter psychrovividus]